MLTSALFSTFHIFALVLGLPAVWLRGRAMQRQDLPALFRADAAWGIAALLWIVTGLTRVFFTEKGPSWYANQPLFWHKMGLFALVFVLEIWPMITFVRWRRLRASGKDVDLTRLPALIRVNKVEVALVIIIPFFASMMARGVGG